MSRKAKRVDSPRPRKTASTRKNQARPHEAPTCDETGPAKDMYAILILKALIEAHAFTEAQAVTVDALHETTGIEVEEIRFLSCQLAAPGFAVLEGPAPVISETEIKHLYIETDPNKLLAFTLGLAQNGIWAHGRAECYAKQYEAMLSAKHPWSSGGLPAVPRLSGTSAAMGT